MVSGIRVSIHVLRLYMTFIAIFYSIYGGLMFSLRGTIEIAWFHTLG